MSKVDIVVPVYNAGLKLHACIRSIRQQSYPNWRLLLVDDGSSDGSDALCKQYAEGDSRIVYNRQPHSGSVSARRRGLELSEAPYILYMDADDWADKRLLEMLMGAALAYGADITVCNMYRVMNDTAWPRRSNGSRYFKQKKLYEADEIRSDLVPAFLHGHPFPPQLHGKLYRRELLLSSGHYVSRIRFFGDDLFLNLELFLKAQTVQIIPDVLYYYRAGGATSRYMPYLFHDMVNGFLIQKEVVESHYRHQSHSHYFGIRVMLLNTLRTCLRNLSSGRLKERERLSAISEYCAHPAVLECAGDEKAAAYFPIRYIRAIRNGDAQYLSKLGKRDYQKSLPKKFVMYAIAKISF
ncbi:glycosyltransferase family 2 protein [Paenibacillus sp. 1011MAR3C5]|uniref:glycosyltransferase family 2 protein n=1 Tax=Paenibacillus sp. 1011MAR3C5 TaxID=1675787 RepID=UPI00160282E2|nr:glycosyltransferase family 2 protein [Paenibacillus sp. 1011MAR3C5]